MKIIGQYILQELDGDYVLLPKGNCPESYNGMCRFNETGAFIWRQIEKRKSVKGVVEAVTKLYCVDSDIVTRDVDDFLGRLEAINVIKR